MSEGCQIDLVDRRSTASRARLLPELAPCVEFEPGPFHQLGEISFFDLMEEVNQAVFNAGQAFARILGPIPPVEALAAVLLILLACTG